MHTSETSISDLKTIKYILHEDLRGTFCKTFQQDLLAKQGIDFEIRESFFSFSHKGVIRGMHFQYPPSDQAKIIFVPVGRIYDVAVDLRKGSDTFGTHYGIELSADDSNALYIPKGFAHGFQSLEDDSMTYYLLDEVYAPDLDNGIRYDSVGVQWPLEPTEISHRDRDFETFAEFDTPFDVDGEED